MTKRLEMDTRNALIEAIQTAENFRLRRASLEDLCESFFMARRFLRSDLQILDHPSLKGQLERMQAGFNLLLEERQIEMERRGSGTAISAKLLA
jgi:hypothetical protein